MTAAAARRKKHKEQIVEIPYGSVETGLNNRTDATTFITYIGLQLVLGKK